MPSASPVQVERGLRASADDVTRLSSSDPSIQSLNYSQRTMLVTRVNDLLDTLEATQRRGLVGLSELLLTDSVSGVSARAAQIEDARGRYLQLDEEQKRLFIDSTLSLFATILLDRSGRVQDPMRIDEEFGRTVFSAIPGMFDVATGQQPASEQQRATEHVSWLDSFLRIFRGPAETVPVPTEQVAVDEAAATEARIAEAQAAQEGQLSATEMPPLSRSGQVYQWVMEDFNARIYGHETVDEDVLAEEFSASVAGARLTYQGNFGEDASVLDILEMIAEGAGEVARVMAPYVVSGLAFAAVVGGGSEASEEAAESALSDRAAATGGAAPSREEVRRLAALSEDYAKVLQQAWGQIRGVTGGLTTQLDLAVSQQTLSWLDQAAVFGSDAERTAQVAQWRQWLNVRAQWNPSTSTQSFTDFVRTHRSLFADFPTTSAGRTTAAELQEEWFTRNEAFFRQELRFSGAVRSQYLLSQIVDPRSVIKPLLPETMRSARTVEEVLRSVGMNEAQIRSATSVVSQARVAEINAFIQDATLSRRFNLAFFTDGFRVRVGPLFTAAEVESSMARASREFVDWYSSSSRVRQVLARTGQYGVGAWDATFARARTRFSGAVGRPMELSGIAGEEAAAEDAARTESRMSRAWRWLGTPEHVRALKVVGVAAFILVGVMFFTCYTIRGCSGGERAQRPRAAISPEERRPEGLTPGGGRTAAPGPGSVIPNSTSDAAGVTGPAAAGSETSGGQAQAGPTPLENMSYNALYNELRDTASATIALHMVQRIDREAGRERREEALRFLLESIRAGGSKVEEDLNALLGQWIAGHPGE